MTFYQLLKRVLNFVLLCTCFYIGILAYSYILSPLIECDKGVPKRVVKELKT